MAETNIYPLDRTYAEEETIEEESELGLESSRSQSAEDSDDDAGTQMSWPAENNSEDEQTPKPNQEERNGTAAPASRAKTSRRVALIAGGSVSVLVLAVIVGTTFVSFEDDGGPFSFATELVDRYTNWGNTPSQTPIENVSMQTSADRGSMDVDFEIGPLGGMRPFEQLGHAVHSQQMERIVLGDSRLQGAALASMIESDAQQLGIGADQAQDYTRLKQTIERQIAPVIERSHHSTAAGREKIQAVIDSAVNSGFALGTTLTDIEIEAIAKESAMEMGVELSVASTVAEQRVQELKLLSGAIEQARTSDAPDRILGQAIEQIGAMREVPPTLDEKGGWLSYAADAAALDAAELEIAAARVQASHQAQVSGMSQNDQQIHADVAAANARANQLGLDDYQAALWVVEHTGHQQALDVMVAERGLGAAAA